MFGTVNCHFHGNRLNAGQFLFGFFCCVWYFLFSCYFYPLHFVSVKNRLTWVAFANDVEYKHELPEWITYCHSNNERNATRKKNKLLDEIEKLPNFFVRHLKILWIVCEYLIICKIDQKTAGCLATFSEKMANTSAKTIRVRWSPI